MKDILYGVKLAILEELDPATQLPKVDGIVCRVDTAESVGLEPVVNEGEENVARSEDKILAIVRTNDLLYGYDVTLTDNTFDPEIAGLVEGAVIKKDADGKVIGYRTPFLGEGASNMKKFRLTLYVANYVGDSIKNYTKIILNNCSGNAPNFTASKEFYAPEFPVKAREATKARLPIKDVDYVDALPTPPAPEISYSEIGTLDNDTDTISDVSGATTVAELLNGLQYPINCGVKLLDVDDKDKYTGTVVGTDTVVVFNLSTGTETVYTITLSA